MANQEFVKKKVVNGFKNNTGYYVDKKTGEVLTGGEALNNKKDWEEHQRWFLKSFMRRYSLPRFWVHEKKWMTGNDFYYLHVLITEGTPVKGAVMIDFDCLKEIVNETKVNTLRAKFRKIGVVEKVKGSWYINPNYYAHGGGIKKSFLKNFKIL